MKMKKPRGDSQQRILEFIKESVQDNGYPPSVREICDAVGLKSTSTVHGHLVRLEKKGLLHRDSMKTRAMEVLDSTPPVREEATQVPVLGRVAAGIPILAEENVEETIPFPPSMLGNGEFFALAIRGESMILAGIMNMDYVLVHRQSQAHNGEIVVAMIDGEATVKRFYKEDGHIRLQPENPSMQPIIVRDVTILGKVVSLYRRL